MSNIFPSLPHLFTYPPPRSTGPLPPSLFGQYWKTSHRLGFCSSPSVTILPIIPTYPSFCPFVSPSLGHFIYLLSYWLFSLFPSLISLPVIIPPFISFSPSLTSSCISPSLSNKLFAVLFFIFFPDISFPCIRSLSRLFLDFLSLAFHLPVHHVSRLSFPPFPLIYLSLSITSCPSFLLFLTSLPIPNLSVVFHFLLFKLFSSPLPFSVNPLSFLFFEPSVTFYSPLLSFFPPLSLPISYIL